MRKFFSKAIFLLLIAVAYFCFCGFNLNYNLLNDGKGSLELIVEKDSLPENIGVGADAFRAYFEEYIERLNVESGDTDFIVPERYTQNDTQFIVTVKTRRIDKVKGLGSIDWTGLSKFLNDEEKLVVLTNFEAGTIRERLKRVYPAGSDGSIPNNKIVTFKKGDNDKSILPVRVADGSEMNLEQLVAESKKSGLNILMFRLADLNFIKSIRIKINGNIRIISSQGVKLTEKNTVEISPFSLIDENGKTVDVLMGYIIFSQNLPPAALVSIIIGGVLLAGFIVAGLRFNLFKKFFSGQLYRNIKKHKSFYLLILPGLAFIIVFHYAPMFGLSTAFKDYKIIDGIDSEWIGLKHFRNILFANTERIYQIFRNTLFISLIRIVTNFPLIIILAVILHSVKGSRIKTFFQTVSYLPYFLSWIAVGGMMFSVFAEKGMMNQLLNIFGKEGITWYTKSQYWWGILSLSSLWKGLGWGTLIYIAAMSSINPELYESCQLDGGGPFRQVITVTLPGIMNIVMMSLILEISLIIRDNYEQILAMTNGSGVLDETVEVVGSYAYQAIARGGGYATATALGLIQGVIGLALVFVTNRTARKSGHEGIL